MYVPYKVFTVSLATTRHCTELLRHWLSSSCCTLHPVTYFMTGGLLNPLHVLGPFPHCPSLWQKTETDSLVKRTNWWFPVVSYLSQKSSHWIWFILKERIRIFFGLLSHTFHQFHVAFILSSTRCLGITIRGWDLNGRPQSLSEFTSTAYRWTSLPLSTRDSERPLGALE